MGIKNLLETIFSALLLAAFAQAQQAGEHDLYFRALRMSDDEQVGFVKAHLDEGDLEGLDVLVRSRSPLVLPLIEKKIEAVVSSKNPGGCFTNKTVNPDRFIAQATTLIKLAGDEVALKEVSKLLVLDAKRFDQLINYTLSEAWVQARPRPFQLAYWAFGLGDPAVDTRVAAWAEGLLDHADFDTPVSARRRWAEVLVERYGGIPTESEWASDPIVSRMRPVIAESLRMDVLRIMRDAWEKSPRRLLAMSDAAQIDFVQAELDRGLPSPQRDAVDVLARDHGSLILPLIEAKIESALKALKPSNCPGVQGADLTRFPVLDMMTLTQAGNLEALRQTAKLMKVNTCRGFAPAHGILENAAERGNLGAVLYGGLEIGNPEVERQLVTWVEGRMAEPSLNFSTDFRRQVAAEMVRRYGAWPTPEQWAKDPLISRLKPSLADSFHADIVRISADVVKRQVQK